MGYLDFDISVTLSDEGACRIAVLRSPAGEVAPTPSRPLVIEPVVEALRHLAEARGVPSRRAPVDEPPPAAPATLLTAADYGRDLFETLMPAAVLAAYRVSVDRARTENKGLRLRLRVDDARLAAVPWEFLFDRGVGDHVCLSVDTSLVRYLDMARPPAPLAVRPPLRVLAVVASPADLPKLDVARERKQLEHAVEHLIDKAFVQIEWLENASWRDVQSAMRRGPWHVFHYIGHSGLDPDTGTGVLAVCDADQNGTFWLGAADLGRLLSGHPDMRLAVLNSCEGARTDGPDLFSSAGGELIRRGVAAVVAMQFPITDRAALEFSRTFYEALVEGVSVDRAVGDARRAIHIALGRGCEWGTPVLHMHTDDGDLFDMDMVSAVFQPRQPAIQPLMGAPAAPAVTPPAPVERAAAPQDLRRGHLLLARKVRTYWVEGVLNRSLFMAAQIELGMDRLEGAVDNPFASVLSEAQRTSRQLAGKTIADVFGEEGGSLLILGEPGAGKTMSMLRLLRQLLERVDTDATAPIPVVFNLSSWKPGQTLADWLVGELSAKYQIPKAIGQAWLAENALLPLFDGLDEVAEPSRAACVTAINDFAGSGVCVGAVVCCRIREYLALPQRLSLNTAIQLRELTADQVLAWVASTGAPLAGLHEALQRNSDLLLDARSPLMLSLMAKTYQGVAPEELAREGIESAKARRTKLMEAYVARMFRRAAGGDA